MALPIDKADARAAYIAQPAAGGGTPPAGAAAIAAPPAQGPARSAAPRKRPSPIRRTGAAAPAVAPRGDSYGYAGLVSALVLACVLWGALWLGNGASTVLLFWLLGVGVGYGVVLHITISVIEHHLVRAKSYIPKPLWAVAKLPIRILSVAVGSVDVLGAALGLLFLAHSWGWSATGIGANVLATLVGEAIAFLPEELFVLFVRILRAVYQARPQPSIK